MRPPLVINKMMKNPKTITVRTNRSIRTAIREEQRVKHHEESRQDVQNDDFQDDIEKLVEKLGLCFEEERINRHSVLPLQ